MKRALLAALAVVATGCVGDAPLHPDLGDWQLDCTLGANEAARSTWLQPCEARASHTVGPKQEIWLAVNPTDARNVVLGAKDNNPASSASCVWNGVSVTHDAGATWSDVVIGGRYVDRKPGELWYDYACNTDPMLRFDAQGDLHYAVEMYNLGGTNSHGPGGPSPATGRAFVQPGWRLLLATSHDGGDSWPDVIELAEGDGIVVLNDYSRMTVSPKTGTILEAIGFLSGTDFTIPSLGLPEPIGGTARDTATHSYCWVTGSRDGGKTPFAPVPVVQNPPKGIACQAIAAAPDGSVVLAGEPGGSAVGGLEGSGHFSFAVSRDDGATWGEFAGGFDYASLPGHFNNTQFRTGTNIEMLFAPNGTLYGMYSDFGTGDADVLVRWSHDLGQSWSPARRVNAGGDGHDQWEPNFALAADGSIHAFWMDRRADPDNRLIGISHGLSLDGGSSWAEEPVSSILWDGDLGVHQEGFPFIGDYIGADAVGNDVWGGFPDASNGATTVVAAAHVAHR